ncbi:MAG: manganese transporter [Phycisphaerae bacterium]|nr:manganese transporter [Phycisphaerae bacterium]
MLAWVVAAVGVALTARAEGPAPRKVVATTGMIADVARVIAGDRARVTGLMGEGVDPHLYKATPGDMRLLADADLILYNGLHLEGRLGDVLVRMARRTPTVQVTDTIPEARLHEPPEFEGHYDPHVWFDVRLWKAVATRIGAALAEIDAEGKEHYAAAAEAYGRSLDELHTWAEERFRSIPEERRLLVTAHDAFGYLGSAYALRVMAIQGISTDSEASIKDINHLVDTVVELKVPAVFVETSVPRKTIEALVEGARARGHRLVIGGELFSDALGRDGTPEGTYIGMVRHNVNTIVGALGPSDRPAAGVAPR